jgi:succinate dehydrogenase / fumarate reductase flavoprotein subunit
MVYLDLTEKATGIPYDTLKRKLGGILDIYEKFVGVDPLLEPMKIYPAVHYSMGGLWVDFARDDKTGGLRKADPRNQMTHITGLYAAGEADYQYHGANRLGANSLLSCIFTGLFMAPGIKKFIEAQKPAAEQNQQLYDDAVERQKSAQNRLLAAKGTDNPYVLHRELGKAMSDNVTIIRCNAKLRQTLDLIESLKDRYQNNLGLPDSGLWNNQSLAFARACWDMILLSEAITMAALARNESRGSHFKIPDELADRHDLPLDQRAMPRDDEHWLKTTLVTYENGRAVLSYEPVDVSLVAPRARNYGKVTAPAPTAATKEPVGA